MSFRSVRVKKIMHRSRLFSWAFGFQACFAQDKILADSSGFSSGLTAGGTLPEPLPTPRLHVLTYSDSFDGRLMLALGSAYEQGVAPLVLGLGKKIGWAYSMGSVYNVYREYIYNNTADDDVILIFDAYDVMFLAGKEELLSIFLAMEARTGRGIFYNGDVFCSSERKAEYPPCDTPWRYLNSGIYMGRGRAMRRLFSGSLSNVVLDGSGKPKRLQNIHTDFYLDHQDLVTIDTKCELTQVVFNLPEAFNRTLQDGAFLYEGPNYLRLSGKRVFNTLTNTSPPLLHFPGVAHWPDMTDPKRVGTCLAYEFFRLVRPTFIRMMENSSLVHKNGKYFGQAPWKPICTFYVTSFDLIGFRVQHVGDWILWVYFNHWWLLVASLAFSCAGGYQCWRRSRVGKRHSRVAGARDLEA